MSKLQNSITKAMKNQSADLQQVQSFVAFGRHRNFSSQNSDLRLPLSKYFLPFSAPAICRRGFTRYDSELRSQNAKENYLEKRWPRHGLVAHCKIFSIFLRFLKIQRILVTDS